MAMFLSIIVVFYSGELVWRERALKVAEVHDALPMPDGVRLGAKMLALTWWWGSLSERAWRRRFCSSSRAAMSGSSRCSTPGGSC